MRPPSPYAGRRPEKWSEITRELVKAHPLDPGEIVDVMLLSWEAIFESNIGSKGFQIGVHIFPRPQIMAFLLHELIPLECESRYPGVWRGDRTADEKDLVYVPNPGLSVEIKTSSHPTQIFGNRSYAQEARTVKKEKSGYYLAANFEKFDSSASRPRVRRVRFGWLDDTDWIGQAAATGQQARLDPQVERGKLLVLYELE